MDSHSISTARLFAGARGFLTVSLFVAVAASNAWAGYTIDHNTKLNCSNKQGNTLSIRPAANPNPGGVGDFFVSAAKSPMIAGGRAVYLNRITKSELTDGTTVDNYVLCQSVANCEDGSSSAVGNLTLVGSVKGFKAIVNYKPSTAMTCRRQ